MAETTTETTAQQPTEQKPTEPSKTETRRAKEKELRAAKKPDYRSTGVTLKVLKGNPKKPGSNANAVYAQYKDGMLVSDLLAMADKGEIKNAKGEVVSKSYAGACLMWDDRHGFIELVAPAPKAEPKPEEKPAEQTAQAQA